MSKEGSVAPRQPGPLLQTIALLTPAFHSLHNAAFCKATISLAGLLLSPLSHSGVRWGLVRLEGIHIPKEGIPEQGVLFGFPDLSTLVITLRKLWEAFPTASGDQGLWEVHVWRIGVLSLLLEDMPACTWFSLWGESAFQCSLKLLPELICLCHHAANLY